MDSMKDYPKIEDVATREDFRYIRLQLCAAIKNVQAHTVSTSLKYSGERWTSVMERMFNPLDGLLRSYKRFKSFRNFRLFVEKVFHKAICAVNTHNSVGTQVPSDIFDLYQIGETFLKVQKDGQEKCRRRKEKLALRQEKMAEIEDSLRLIPKPANLNNLNVSTPSTNVNDPTCEVSVQKVTNLSSDVPVKKRKVVDFESTTGIDSDILPRRIDFCPESSKKTKSSVSKKKAVPNRGVQMINFFDGQATEMDNMFKQLDSTLKKIVDPPKTEFDESNVKMDHLQKLLKIKKNLDEENIDSSAILKKIELLLNEMN